MAVERQAGYKCRGWKLGEKVKYQDNGMIYEIVGFDEDSPLYFIAINKACSKINISSSVYADSYIKTSSNDFEWVKENDIEKIENNVENAKNETFDKSIINKLKQVDEENKEMLKEIKQCKHYSDTGIEPIEFIIANNYGFNQGNIVKYNHRVGKKKGQEVSDIKKIIDYALLLAYEKGIELNEDELIELIKYRINIIKEYKNDRKK